MKAHAQLEAQHLCLACLIIMMMLAGAGIVYVGHHISATPFQGTDYHGRGIPL